MKIKVEEIVNQDNDLQVVFQDFYKMGQDAARKVYGS